MLTELRLENYAVIDNLVVEFGPGLNLLTGETGAGKSILIDALALLLGEKASTEVIRSGAERAVIAAVFEAEGKAEKALGKILDANGLDESDDGSLILRREIAAGGKGRVFVNNQPATVSVLKLLAPHLAIIHAQNESILSFDGPARLELLDAFAGSEIEPVVRLLRRVEARFARASRNWSAESRTSCAWSTYGRSRSGRSKRRSCRAGKTSGWKPRNACSRMPRRSTTRR